jgi:hypothetical protein
VIKTVTRALAYPPDLIGLSFAWLADGLGAELSFGAAFFRRAP